MMSFITISTTCKISSILYSKTKLFIKLFITQLTFIQMCHILTNVSLSL